MFWTKKRSSATIAPVESDPLDRVLFHWPRSHEKDEPVRIADMLRGTNVFGATGSGKSSGSGKTIAKAFCEAGFGGLVLCVKPDERETWEKFAEQTGRTDDLVIFNEESKLEFNPILYELKREDEGGGQTINIVNLIMNIYQLGRTYTGGGSSNSGDAFWDNALRRLLSRSIDLIRLAVEELSISTMRKAIISAPYEKDAKHYRECLDHTKDLDYANEAMDEIETLGNESYCIKCLEKARKRKQRGLFNADEQRTYALVNEYFTREFANLAERTRTSIQEHFYGLAEPFVDGILNTLFCAGISRALDPIETYANQERKKIIIVDFPIKNYLIAGVYSQGIVKYMWQQAMQRRKPKDEENPSPVFLYCDEAQFLINPNYDAQFQTTARSALVCTVYLTQNINNYYFAFGGADGKAKARSLLANMANKVFHGNTCTDTNQFAADIIGRDITMMGSVSGRYAGTDPGSFSEQIQYLVQPNEFLTLKYGRKENDHKVEAIIVKTGPWKHSLDTFIDAEFTQDIDPSKAK